MTSINIFKFNDEYYRVISDRPDLLTKDWTEEQINRKLLSNKIEFAVHDNCVWCENCDDCFGCENCKDCVDCDWCEFCVKCDKCEDCNNCYKISGIKNESYLFGYKNSIYRVSEKHKYKMFNLWRDDTIEKALSAKIIELYFFDISF